MAKSFDSHRAQYWHRLDDGRIQCDLCPRFCKLHEGQRAFCFVRARQGDKMVLTTYGRSSGFCVDPVEKKALNHFLPVASAVVRDQRLQSGLQVLPELGHQQGARYTCSPSALILRTFRCRHRIECREVSSSPSSGAFSRRHAAHSAVVPFEAGFGCLLLLRAMIVSIT